MAPAAERGAGAVGVVTGVLAFLLLLLLAAQVLYNLYATSVLTTVAFDAARTVAAADGDPMATARADDRLRRLLGGYYHRTRFSWSMDDETVALRVQADNANVILRGLPLDGIEEVDRTVRVRRECARVGDRCR